MLCEMNEILLVTATTIVLILVLMEDVLRGCQFTSIEDPIAVLILVLMEDALRELDAIKVEKLSLSLNPCFNGRCSARLSAFPV